MPTLPYTILDVFTDQPYRGNPLAVVEQASDLTAEQMQAITHEFNLSETIFVMPPQDPAHTARVQIFCPGGELPFAGHPTIGCALHLAHKHGLTHVALEENAGLVPVTIIDDLAEFRAPVIPTATGATPPHKMVAAALGLNVDEIGPDTPATHSGGPAFLFVCVTNPDALSRARPHEPHWSALMDMAGDNVDSAWIYTGTLPQIHARMFSPTGGIPEDPATGSASAIFANQLHSQHPLSDGTHRLSITQGADMGRPSQIGLRIRVDAGLLSAVHVSGKAVEVARGTITPPSRRIMPTL